MNVQEFIDLVKEMRAAQKAYFKRQSPSNMLISMELERRVDKALAEKIKIPEDQPKQMDLFATANTAKGE